MIRRFLRWLTVFIVLTALAVALAVASVETGCQAAGPPPSPKAGRFGVADKDYRLPVTNSVLSYPEWYIVYAYQDFATALRGGDEAAFPYLDSISDYWSSLCVVNRVASAQGSIDFGQKVMLYVIGFSFTAELGVKGAYETTIGRLTAWLRGPEKTSEDRLALAVAEEYAAFLDQKPWYEYSFLTQVRRLLNDTPFGHSSVRAGERRFALTLEWTVKSGYAWVIARMAELDPAVLKIRSVVRDGGDLAQRAGAGLAVQRALGDDKALIETPRYGAFTKILTDFAAEGRQVFEIAGNDVIFITVLAPDDATLALDGARTIFTYPDRSRSRGQRVGLLVEVPALTQAIRQMQSKGARLEHVYDY